MPGGVQFRSHSQAAPGSCIRGEGGHRPDAAGSRLLDGLWKDRGRLSPSLPRSSVGLGASLKPLIDIRKILVLAGSTKPKNLLD
jgi:hypothetical protein